MKGCYVLFEDPVTAARERSRIARPSTIALPTARHDGERLVRPEEEVLFDR
jgi:hypothetical protein